MTACQVIIGEDYFRLQIINAVKTKDPIPFVNLIRSKQQEFLELVATARTTLKGGECKQKASKKVFSNAHE